jgi:hypothetical protein
MGHRRDPSEDLGIEVEGDDISCLQLKFRLADPLFLATGSFQPHGAFLHGVLDGDFRELAGRCKKIRGKAVRGDGDTHRALRGGTYYQITHLRRGLGGDIARARSYEVVGYISKQ